MTKLLTPRVVAARMLADIKDRVAQHNRELATAKDLATTLGLCATDTPSEWVSVKDFVLQDREFYFVQRVFGARPVGDVCLAAWYADTGWREIIGKIIHSHASDADLLVLVAKQKAKRAKQKAKGVKKRR